MRYALILALTAQGAAAAAAAGMAQLGVNLTANSPLIVWTPAPTDPDPEGPALGKEDPNAWQVLFTGSPWAKWNKWTVGNGSNYHLGPAGASLKVAWEGTAIDILGTGYDGEPGPQEYYDAGLDFRVDGKPIMCTGGRRCSTSNLDSGTHEAVLTVKSGRASISRIFLKNDFRFNGDPSTAEVVEYNAFRGSSDIDPHFVITSGEWLTATDVTSGDLVADNVPRIYTNTPGAAVQVTSPKGAGFVKIWGAVDWDHRDFEVDVFPPPPNGQDKFVGSAYNPWTIHHTVLYMTRLDPKVEYNITFTHLAQPVVGLAQTDLYSDISKYEFFMGSTEAPSSSSGSSGSSSSTLNGGIIAAIVVCSVAGVIIIVGLFWYFCVYRRNRRQTSTLHPLRGPIDAEGVDTVYGPAPTPATFHTGPTSPNTSEPLLSMRQRQGMSHLSSGYSSSVGDSETMSQTTGGFAGVGVYPNNGMMPPATAPLIKGQQANSGIEHRFYQQHADGGAVVHNPDPTPLIVDVPPSYNPQWVGSSSGGSAAGDVPGAPPRKN